MTTFCRAAVVALLVAGSSGCGGSALFQVRTVEGGGRSEVLPPRAAEPAGPPLGGVKLFFYPYVSDSVIHPVPEREFITDGQGRADITEKLSPTSDKMGALVSMKAGYYVDTLFFNYASEDTLNLLVRLHRR